MREYSDLMSEALRKNLERVDTLKAFQSAIHAVNITAANYENEPGISMIVMSYPTYGNDYLLVTIYLTEKGRVMKDVGSFIDDLRHRLPGLDYDGDVQVDATLQTKTWRLIDRQAIYAYEGETKHPRITVLVNASRSTNCVRRETGEMVPVYEFVCLEE